jgi:hypothetical protein
MEPICWLRGSVVIPISTRSGDFFPNASNFNVNNPLMAEHLEVYGGIHQHYRDFAREHANKNCLS